VANSRTARQRAVRKCALAFLGEVWLRFLVSSFRVVSDFLAREIMKNSAAEFLSRQRQLDRRGCVPQPFLPLDPAEIRLPKTSRLLQIRSTQLFLRPQISTVGRMGGSQQQVCFSAARREKQLALPSGFVIAPAPPKNKIVKGRAITTDSTERQLCFPQLTGPHLIGRIAGRR
jgi:hypothetical protein